MKRLIICCDGTRNSADHVVDGAACPSGIFEYFLGEEARRRGIDFRDAAVVKPFAIGANDNELRVSFEQDGCCARADRP
jgi:hypothetical protein